MTHDARDPEQPTDEDPILDDVVERAVARLPPLPASMQEDMRRALKLALSTHPRSRALLEQLRDRAPREKSDLVAKAGVDARKDKKAGGDL